MALLENVMSQSYRSGPNFVFTLHTNRLSIFSALSGVVRWDAILWRTLFEALTLGEENCYEVRKYCHVFSNATLQILLFFVHVFYLVFYNYGVTLQMVSNILTADKHTKHTTKTPHTHVHIERKEKTVKCTGKTLLDDFCKYYQGDNHCIFIRVSKGIKKRACDSKI